MSLEKIHCILSHRQFAPDFVSYILHRKLVYIYTGCPKKASYFYMRITGGIFSLEIQFAEAHARVKTK